LIVLALPVTVLLGMPQPWSGLAARPLSAWRLATAALLLARVAVRRLVPASELLGSTDPAALLPAARLDRDLDRRAAPAAHVRALGLIARADLIWVLPAATGIGWLLFGITDLVTVISRLSAAELTQMSSPLRWQQLVVTAPILLLVLLGLALSPALSVILAAPQ